MNAWKNKNTLGYLFESQKKKWESSEVTLGVLLRNNSRQNFRSNFWCQLEEFLNEFLWECFYNSLGCLLNKQEYSDENQEEYFKNVSKIFRQKYCTSEGWLKDFLKKTLEKFLQIPLEQFLEEVLLRSLKGFSTNNV